MISIGKGLMANEKIQTLSLKGNHIEHRGIEDLIDAFNMNPNLRLKNLDLSSNRLNVSDTKIYYKQHIFNIG